MDDAALPVKIACLALLAVISLTCGLLPLAVSRLAHLWTRRHKEGGTVKRLWGRTDVLISCVLCLGGGVLMGTVFTHMLPEIREVFDQIQGTGLLPAMQPPPGEVFTCAGFFIVYLVEELVHAFLAGRDKRSRRESLPLTQLPAVATVVQVHGDREAMSWNEGLYRSAVPAAPAADRDPGHGHDHDHNAGGHDHGAAIATLQAFRAYVVIIALSVHAVFEGFAVALETQSRDVWILFAAIATHKAIVSFCLGEQLLATKRSVCFIVTNVALLAAASPLGITLGILVEQLDQDESSRLLTTGIMQSLAAGTILYVVFFEILGPERQKHSNGLLKFAAVVAGFALIVLVHSTSSHSHGLPPPPQGAVRSHAGHGRSHGHSTGHGHDHGGDRSGDDASGQFSTDYLARVPNESGHVYDTVRYIKSFNRPEGPNIDHQEIINSMRNVVKNLGGRQRQHEEQQARGTVISRESQSSDSHEHGGAPQRQAGHLHDADEPAHDPHEHDTGETGSGSTREDHHHGNGPHHDGEPADGPGGQPGDTAERHHHSHAQFMRTVEDLAGRLRGEDQRAVDRTVSLIDRLDLIATHNTARSDDSRSPRADHDAPGDHQPIVAEQHAGDDGDSSHEHSQHSTTDQHGGDGSGSLVKRPDVGLQPRIGHEDKHWLHSDVHHGGRHEHFVLQDNFEQPSGNLGALMSQDADKQLQQMTEVKFHEPKAVAASTGAPNTGS